MIREFVVPKINWFGSQSITKISELVSEKKFGKALIITDKNLVACGISKKIEDVLDESGVQWTCYDSVRPNPTKENVYEALDLLKRENCDFIIGLGGGSANDCAKSVSVLANNGGKIEDYTGFNRSEKDGVPIIAVNTTAGTASEISRAYLISDEENHEKIICKDIHALPYASINDQELMLGLPESVTAQTGMDALTHALESYVCNNSSSLTMELAIGAMHLVFNNLRGAVKEPLSLEYRENMSYAQSLAGMAFCNSGVGLDHAIAHALGSSYGLPHGLCTAVVLPGVISFNRQKVENLYAELGKRLFPEKCLSLKSERECADVFYDEVIRLSKEIGTCKTLSQIGVKEEELEDVAEKALNDGNIGRNPLIPDKGQLVSLLYKML